MPLFAACLFLVCTTSRLVWNLNPSSSLQSCQLHTWSLIWNLKINPGQRRFLLEVPSFSDSVLNFGGVCKASTTKPTFCCSFCQLINGHLPQILGQNFSEGFPPFSPPLRVLLGSPFEDAHWQHSRLCPSWRRNQRISSLFSLKEFCYPPSEMKEFVPWKGTMFRRNFMFQPSIFRGCLLVFRGSPPGWWIAFCLEYQLLVELPSLKLTAKASENRLKISRNPKGKVCLSIIGIFRGFGS